jgi:hypothetical protein
MAAALGGYHGDDPTDALGLLVVLFSLLLLEAGWGRQQDARRAVSMA